MVQRYRISALVLAAILAAGCATRSERRRLNSPSALDRAQAAVRLADAHDAESVHRLVGLLEDGDAAVRMYAILSLEHLTGETFGYRYFDAEPDRQVAVQRWHEAIRDGRVRLAVDRKQPPTSLPAATPGAE